jgi:hypothetical protein
MVDLPQPARATTKPDTVPRALMTKQTPSITTHTGAAAMNNASQAFTLNDYRIGVRSRPDTVALTSTSTPQNRALPILLAVLVAVAAFGAWTLTHGGVYF